MNVVIVEDEGITAMFLKETVEFNKHTVIGVCDSGDALFIFLEDHDVDLIFMDIQINGALDGIQVADLVHHKYPHISFVFLTSYKDTQTIESARVVRPLGYLIKPVLDRDIEAILMVVEGSIYQQKVQEPKVDIIDLGEYVYDIRTESLFRGEYHVPLSKNESLCLRELLLHRGMHVSIDQLLYSIWGEEENRLSSLRELTYRLRKKLPGLVIDNIPNIGYIIRAH